MTDRRKERQSDQTDRLIKKSGKPDVFFQSKTNASVETHNEQQQDMLNSVIKVHKDSLLWRYDSDQICLQSISDHLLLSGLTLAMMSGCSMEPNHTAGVTRQRSSRTSYPNDELLLIDGVLIGL